MEKMEMETVMDREDGVEVQSVVTFEKIVVQKGTNDPSVEVCDCVCEAFLFL